MAVKEKTISPDAKRRQLENQASFIMPWHHFTGAQHGKHLHHSHVLFEGVLALQELVSMASSGEEANVNTHRASLSTNILLESMVSSRRERDSMSTNHNT